MMTPAAALAAAIALLVADAAAGAALALAPWRAERVRAPPYTPGGSVADLAALAALRVVAYATLLAVRGRARTAEAVARRVDAALLAAKLLAVALLAPAARRPSPAGVGLDWIFAGLGAGAVASVGHRVAARKRPSCPTRTATATTRGRPCPPCPRRRRSRSWPASRPQTRRSSPSRLPPAASPRSAPPSSRP